MKQRARAQIAAIKRTAIKQHQSRAGRVGQVRAFIAGEGDDDDATIELTKGDRDAEMEEGPAEGDTELMADIKVLEKKPGQLLHFLIFKGLALFLNPLKPGVGDTIGIGPESRY